MIEQIKWDELIEQYDETQNCVPLVLAASTTLQPTPRPSDPDWQVPLDTEIQTWISEVHGGERGHGGLERTLRLLQEKAKRTWKTMRRDVRRYIRNCPACQLLSDTKIKAAVTPYNVSVWRPMERLNIDTIGPLPDDERGNCYIIVIIDVFSRFTELYPTRDATARSAAEAIVQHIGRYGVPEQVLTDNGPQYIAELMKEVFNRVNTEHLTILPYSHEENSIVERANKEVGRHLRTIIFDKQIKNEWAIALPLVQRIMNA